MSFEKICRRSVGEIDRTKSRSIQHVLGFLSEFRLSSRGVNLFSFSAMRSRRKHYSNHGCAERLPKRSQITMECRQTSVPVRGTRWHTERSNDPCTVQRLRKEITPYRERQRGMEGRGAREREREKRDRMDHLVLRFVYILKPRIQRGHVVRLQMFVSFLKC